MNAEEFAPRFRIKRPAAGVQTPQDGPERAVAGVGTAPAEIAPPCACGCNRPVAVKDGKPLKWAGDGCRQRYWNLRHPQIDLSGLTVEQARDAGRMVEEAVVAARLGQRRATVDAAHPVTHENAVRPDPRPSCRIRLTADEWDDLEWIGIFLGLPTRTAVVHHLISRAMRQVREIAFGEEEVRAAPEDR